MNLKNFFCIGFVALTATNESFGQNSRIKTQNNIGWYNYFGTFKASKRIDIHTEYQWRRNNLIQDWQQSLLRVGINYNLNPRVVFRLGYARVETYPYGDYTINEFGKQFSEDRIFQMFQLSHKEGNIDFSHRFILEQRFIGAYSSADQTTEDKLLTSNRARYLFKFFLPLSSSNPKNNAWYTAFSNEVFINFGQNIQHNVFDQNRISILLGYRLNKNIRMEGGYLNQIVQFGRLIGNRPLLQFNNGIILNTYFNIDLTKREETLKHLDETQ